MTFFKVVGWVLMVGFGLAGCAAVGMLVWWATGQVVM